MTLTKAYLEQKALLAADKLMHYDDTRATAMSQRGGIKEGVIARDFGISEWDWPQGVGLLGLTGLNAHFGDGRYDAFFGDWFEANLRRGLPGRNINTTAPMHALVEQPALMAEPRYRQLCREWAQWLMDGLPKTPENGFQHVVTSHKSRDEVTLNTGELWIDTLFMAVLFLAKMGQREQRTDWSAEALHQVLLHIKYLYDKKTGLFHHAWQFDGRHNFGGVLWLRGNSWFTLGIMEYLAVCGEALSTGVRAFLLDTFRAQAEALLALQAPSGLWHTVLDDESSYEETSGSANIAAGLLRGVRLGVLPETALEPALRAVAAVAEQVAADGVVEGVSGGTVVGQDAAHYQNIIIAPMAYGQAMALLALREALHFV